MRRKIDMIQKAITVADKQFSFDWQNSHKWQHKNNYYMYEAYSSQRYRTVNEPLYKIRPMY